MKKGSYHTKEVKANIKAGMNKPEVKAKLRKQRVERIEVKCNYCGEPLFKMPCEIKKSNGGKFYCCKDHMGKDPERKKIQGNGMKKHWKKPGTREAMSKIKIQLNKDKPEIGRKISKAKKQFHDDHPEVAKETGQKRKQATEDNPLITYDVLYGLYVDQEMTERQISKLLGRGAGTVHRYLTEVHKIPTRSVSDYCEDLVGQEFGSRVVLSMSSEIAQDRSRKWNTVCKCGKKQTLSTGALKQRGSCGCSRTDNFNDLTGKQISFLFMKEFLGYTYYHTSERERLDAEYLCVCVCGNEVTRSRKSIKGAESEGVIQSCGCCAGLKNYGEGNPNWRGGKSGQPYCDIWKSKDFHEEIRERDGYQCQNPDCWGTCKKGHALAIHHIDGNPLNCNPWNLITVCRSCNTRAEGSKEKSRDEWQVEYHQIMSERYGYEYDELSLLEAVNQ